MILQSFSHRLSRTLVALCASMAVAIPVTTPTPAHADRGGVVAGAILGAAIICAANPKACGGGRGGRAGGGGGGPADAIAMTRDQKMMVQGGLQNLGFYTGAIDGAIGAGTRGSIKNYQTAIGASATGRLTGAEINDLVALSPGFVRYPIGDVNLFNADIAPDLDRDGVRQLQAALNGAGYNAGPVDGAMGGKTRDAIRLYKINNGLPGDALATRRLLAHLHGHGAPIPAGIEMAAVKPAGLDGGAGYVAGMDAGAGAGAGGAGYAGGAGAGYPGGGVPVAAPGPAPMPTVPGAKDGQGKAVVTPGGGGAAEPVVVAGAAAAAPAPAAPAAMDLTFDILGAKLGTDRTALDEVLKIELGGDLLTGGASADVFGGSAVLADARQWVQPGWSATSGEQIVALSDPARPDQGTLAMFRLVRMPAAVDQAVFEEHVLPELLAYYGESGRVGDSLTWIGNGAAREAALASASDLAACGDMRLAAVPEVASGMEALWIKGNGVTMDSASLESVAKACGTVVKVSFQPGLLTIGLWNSDALSGGGAAGGAAIPRIKF